MEAAYVVLKLRDQLEVHTEALHTLGKKPPGVT